MSRLFPFLSWFVFLGFALMGLFYMGGCRPFLHTFPPVTQQDLETSPKSNIEIQSLRWEFTLSPQDDRSAYWFGQMRIKIHPKNFAFSLKKWMIPWLDSNFHDNQEIPFFAQQQSSPKIYVKTTCRLGHAKYSLPHQFKKISVVLQKHPILSSQMSIRSNRLEYSTHMPQQGCIVDISFGLQAILPVAGRLVVPLVFAFPVRFLDVQIKYPRATRMHTSFQQMKSFWSVYQKHNPSFLLRKNWISTRMEKEPLQIRHDSERKLLSLQAHNLPSLAQWKRHSKKGYPKWLSHIQQSSRPFFLQRPNWGSVAKQITSFPLSLQQERKHWEKKGMQIIPAFASSQTSGLQDQEPQFYLLDVPCLYWLPSSFSIQKQDLRFRLPIQTAGRVVWCEKNRKRHSKDLLVLHKTQPFWGHLSVKKK